MDLERQNLLRQRLENINAEFKWGSKSRAFDALVYIVDELVKEVGERNVTVNTHTHTHKPSTYRPHITPDYADLFTKPLPKKRTRKA